MGIRGKRGGYTEEEYKKLYTEENIIRALEFHFLSPSSKKYSMANLYVFDYNWESDYLAITKSGYCYEGEVKISRSDFNADFKKKDKHLILEGKSENSHIKPNYFFYAVPEGMITEEEVPEYAGLVYVNITDNGSSVSIVKQPPKLHSEKYTDEQLNLTEKFYYNMVNWRQKALFDFPEKIKELKEQIKLDKTDENGNKYKYTLGEANEKIIKLEEELQKQKRFYKEISEAYLDERSERRKLLREMKKDAE